MESDKTLVVAAALAVVFSTVRLFYSAPVITYLILSMVIVCIYLLNQRGKFGPAEYVLPGLLLYVGADYWAEFTFARGIPLKTTPAIIWRITGYAVTLGAVFLALQRLLQP